MATRFSEFAVAALDYLFDSFDPHLFHLQIRISKPIRIFLILADLEMKSIDAS
jgi:hypothetical protein